LIHSRDCSLHNWHSLFSCRAMTEVLEVTVGILKSRSK
jgi:hypothetical protein